MLKKYYINYFIQNTRYFLYSGSLTTPKCQEVVKWIVSTSFSYITQEQVHFKNRYMMLSTCLRVSFLVTTPIHLNKDLLDSFSFSSKMRIFRRLRSFGGKTASDNFRPTQPLNHRRIYLVSNLVDR